MLTSVDKMFIRFIFAKDMQLHYIWYYKILIKKQFLLPLWAVFNQPVLSSADKRVAILYFYLFFFF